MDPLAGAVRQLAAAAAALAAALAGRAEGAFAPALPALSCGPTVGELVRAFIQAKTRLGSSKGYLVQLRVHLGFLCKRFGARPAAALTTADLEAFIPSRGGRTSQANALCAASVCFNWGVRRGLVPANPARGVEMRRKAPAAVSLHTPDQVRAVLTAARARDSGAARFLAVRYFAGLRGSEAVLLTPENIRRGFIEVPAAIAKTRARRLVPIVENLAAWLALPGDWPGPDRAVRVGPMMAAAAGLPKYRNSASFSPCLRQPKSSEIGVKR